MPRASPDFSRHEKGSFKRLLIILDVNNGRQWYNSCKNIATESITTISDINNKRSSNNKGSWGDACESVSSIFYLCVKLHCHPVLEGCEMLSSAHRRA